MSKEHIETAKFRLDGNMELQSKNPSPDEGKFVACGGGIANQKQQEGLKVYEIGKNGAKIAKDITEDGSYAYLNPIPKDNLRHI